MNTSRIIIALISLTVVLQLSVLYQQRQSQVAGARSTPEPIQEAPSETTISLSDLPTLGDENASLVLAEFADYECPFCARHANSVAKQIKSEYVATGLLRLAFVNNPLDMHPNARFLATAAICAGDQGKYWEMHDALFEMQPETSEEILELGDEIGLAVDELQTCIEEEPTVNDRIERDAAIAENLGFSATPTFALGYMDGDTVVLRSYILGAQPFGVFEEELEKLMDERL